ncbi:MAG: molecular chaperone HtpG [Chlamydiales bacterium]|nr:molecular chaperone HtpG [Chlamydiales bacterium]
MTSGQLQIHSENILPILKKWLYSDRDIFVRELISNGCDAIHKLKVLRDEGQAPATEEPDQRVTVKIDKEARTLTFSDTGLGMDAEEVEKYICQLAFSGAEEFIAKYKSNKESDRIIGHFGLGFFSAYMVASKVVINTLSYKPDAEPVLWSCEGGTDYELSKGTKTTVGTDVILHIDADNEEYLDHARLKQILDHYCTFLPYPIYLNDQHINHKEPLWIKSPSECTDDDYIDFYSHLYPGTPAPLFWVHLNVDYPFNLKGILFFPKLERKHDIRKHGIKLYCNRVFVSDDCKDIMPEYLTMLRGAIDSPDIPLNVSRSHLQMDRTVRQLSSHISKKVSDSLATLHRVDRDKFIAAWKDISIVIKLGAVEDEKFFERVKPLLVWKTVDGSWTSVEDYLAKNSDKTKGKVFYTTDERHAEHILQAYRDKQIDVIVCDSPIDSYLINTLEKKLDNVKFQRIDAEIDDTLIDTSREKTVLDADGRTPAAHLADFFRQKLDSTQLEVEAKSLTSDNIPAVLVMDEQMRRFREYVQTAELDGFEVSMLGKPKLIVNTNSPLINAIVKLEESDASLAEDMVQEVYQLAQLSQRELSQEALGAFVTRSHKILETLAQRALNK